MKDNIHFSVENFKSFVRNMEHPRFRVRYLGASWYYAIPLNTRARILLNGKRTFIFNNDTFKRWTPGIEEERILWTTANNY